MLLFVFNTLSGKKTFLSTNLTKKKLTEIKLFSKSITPKEYNLI